MKSHVVLLWLLKNLNLTQHWRTIWTKHSMAVKLMGEFGNIYSWRWIFFLKADLVEKVLFKIKKSNSGSRIGLILTWHVLFSLIFFNFPDEMLWYQRTKRLDCKSQKFSEILLWEFFYRTNAMYCDMENWMQVTIA